METMVHSVWISSLKPDRAGSFNCVDLRSAAAGSLDGCAHDGCQCHTVSTRASSVVRDHHTHAVADTSRALESRFSHQCSLLLERDSGDM
jgi:hypothetical protein